MSNPNGDKGAQAERMVAKYLRTVGFPAADRRLREGRRDDMGDIDGIPFTTVQVKHVAQPALQTWITATLRQRENAGNSLCLLIVRKLYKQPAGWDAYLPGGFGYPEEEAWTWVRMDLRLAAVAIETQIGHLSRLNPFWSSSSPRLYGDGGERLSAPSIVSDDSPSPTTWTSVCSTALPAMPEAPRST